MLASRSPRRRELARGAGWNVVLHPPADDVEASAPPRRSDETLEAYVVRLARAKAAAVGAEGVVGTILACDTLSEVDGRFLGQPTDVDDARRMLESLSGRSHRVVTGICLWERPRLEPLEASAESWLAMDPLEEDFLGWYLQSGLWRGKAGACGFQDERLPLRLVSGSASNVVGLPLERIGEVLAERDRQLAGSH